MILFHSIYTMPLNRYSRMDATGDIRLVARWSLVMPKFLCKNHFRELQAEVGRVFGGQDILSKDIMRLTMYNRITLYRAALLALTYEPKNAKILQWWADTFGGKVDLERLKNEIERLIFRYKELRKKEPTVQKYFEDLVSRVEVILGFSINRNISIFEFKHQYDNAIRKGKQK